jgi:hypothetical protein
MQSISAADILAWEAQLQRSGQAFTDSESLVWIASTSVLKQNGHEMSRPLRHETKATYANGGMDGKW